MKYALQTIDVDAATTTYIGDTLDEMKQLKTDIASMDSADITPINCYLDFSQIKGDSLAGGVKIGNSYVWISNGDVSITAPSGTNGKVTGLILAKGDVTFVNDETTPSNNVTRFEGLIVTGSKIKISHDIDFIANAEIVKTILRTAEATSGEGSSDYSFICDIFKDYKSSSSSEDPDAIYVENIEIGDILRYANWKKNVE
jgi:hypothetical protein